MPIHYLLKSWLYDEASFIFQSSQRYYKYQQRYNQILSGFLLEKFENIINKPLSSRYLPYQKRIWVFWWQGECLLPDICKVCLHNLRLHHEDKVIFLSKDNLRDYVTISPIIIDKFEHGQYSHAHFSDLVRLYLLSHYGGIWVDATLLLTRPIPDLYFEKPFISIKTIEQERGTITRYRWCSFFIGTDLSCDFFLGCIC